MDRLRRRLQTVWTRSPSALIAAIVATVVGVVALTLGAVLLFGNAKDRPQQDASPSTALSFAVFAGSTVDNTGASVITGDLGGAKPGNPIKGFPPGIVHGTTHGADAVAFQAQTDLTTAYFDAANRRADMELPADVGGMTLVPGVYSQARALTLTGTLTLDGRDDPSALFIFQAGADLDVSTDSVVSLVNGAQACNVFWQVGASATVGSNVAFSGTILAAGSASVETGTTVDGRLLARNGEVTLDLSTVTIPTCDEAAEAGPFAKTGTAQSDADATTTIPSASSGGSSTTYSSPRSTTSTSTTTAGSVPTVTTEPTTTDPTTTDPTTTETTTTDTTTTDTTTTDPETSVPIETPPPGPEPPPDPPPVP